MGKEGPGYVGYIFQCESSSVVDDILQGLRSAFITAHEAARYCFILLIPLILPEYRILF
jgi:hypothetical protein